MGKVIKLTESYLRNRIQEAVHNIIKEAFNGYDEPESASEDFYNSGCEDTLTRKYPSMDFEFDVSDDGTVTALDINTGKYYTGKGEIEYDIVGLGYPSHNDYDSEAEGEVAYYDFYNCLKTIMQKIDNDQPDGVNDDYIETSVEEIGEAMKKVIGKINEANNTFWGRELDGWQAFGGRIAKGVAQDFIQKNGEPKTIEAVASYIDTNRNNGFGFYTENMFRYKTGFDTKVGITKDGLLCCYIDYNNIKGKQRKFLSSVKYDFNKPLISNLKWLYDKTPSNIKLT